MADPLDSQDWALKPAHVPGLPPWIDVHPEHGLTIGRADDNDVVLAADDHAQVSAHHCRIVAGEDGLELHDLGSTNGTFVNGMKVESKSLKGGDLIGLGRSGPKFVVERRSDMSNTRLIEPAKASPKFGESTVMLVREAVGLDADADVHEAVHASTRRSRVVLVLLILVVVFGGGVAVWMLQDSQDEIEGLIAELERTKQRLEAQQNEWNDTRERLRQEKLELTSRLQSVESAGNTSSPALEALRQKLEKTEKQLALFDPVNLERTRLAGVKQVSDTVVFIETRWRLRDPKSGKLVREVSADGSIPGYEVGGAGAPAEQDKTGSGFVVTAEGWVLTNAHVVEGGGAFGQEEIDVRGVKVKPEYDIDVVFNEQSVRHEAELVSLVHEDDSDFALLKIEPFEGMPHIRDFRIDRPAPQKGSEVYLFGFPLGRMLVQDGDSYAASTFKGILSRVVPPYLQVDAAVHPGNSGGPVIDGSGNVIGIVTAVQRMPEGHITPAIGFVMPIEGVARIWPPPGR